MRVIPAPRGEYKTTVAGGRSQRQGNRVALVGRDEHLEGQQPPLPVGLADEDRPADEVDLAPERPALGFEAEPDVGPGVALVDRLDDDVPDGDVGDLAAPDGLVGEGAELRLAGMADAEGVGDVPEGP